jgi:tetratricopeptide (TPR) repeat protein
MRDIKAQALLEYAQNEELGIATSRLLSYIFSEDIGNFKNPGRYVFLESVIREDQQLLDALLKEARASALSQWQQALEGSGSDVQFHHGLAVLYQEQAVESFNRGVPDERLWLMSTALWLHLLCTDEFWEYFSRARLTERESSSRKDLDEAQQKALFQEAWQSILLLHNNYGRQDYAAGRYAQAGIHLKCLDLCRKDEKTIAKTLSGLGIPYKLEASKNKRKGVEAKKVFDVMANSEKKKASASSFDSGRLDAVKSMAEGFLDDWGNTLVSEAEKITDNPEAIKNLPPGIRKNYQGGIRYLQPFIDIGIPVSRILRASLLWYCDWCYDLYTREDLKSVKELMVPSRKVADMLAPLCIKARGYMPENQALSTHYMLRGFTAGDPDQMIKEYEEALEWNPSNDNAQQLLGGATQQVLQKQLNTAIECAKRKQFKEAYDVLDSLEKQIKEKDEMNMARAVVNFTHANTLANEGKFREALPHAREAMRLVPAEKAIIDLLKEMEELAPEEDNLRYMRSASEHFDKERYDSSISDALLVSRSSRYYAQAQTLQSAAYFARGIAYAKRKQYDMAVTDLERSLAANGNNNERKIISEQLEVLKQNKMSYDIDEALKSKNWSWAESMLRRAISGERSSKVKRQMEVELSQVLNAHAVSLANDGQDAMKKFGDALNMIVIGVKAMQQSGSGYSGYSGFGGDGTSCPVCGPASGKTRIMKKVISVMQFSGTFPINGVEGFWSMFRSELCYSCQSKLDSIQSSKSESIRLLEEAIALDRSNSAARKNLEAIRKI